MDIKDLIIFLIIFIIIMWLQNNDDKKFNKNERISIYDKIKIPLFVSCSILLIKNYKFSNTTESLFIFSSINNSKDIFNNNSKDIFNNNSKDIFNNNSKDIFNDIYTEPPDF